MYYTSLPLAAFLLAPGAPATSPHLEAWPPLPTSLATVSDLDHASASFPNSAAIQERRLSLALGENKVEVAEDAVRWLGKVGTGLPSELTQNVQR